MTMDVNTSDIIRYLLWRVISLLHLCSSLLQLGQAGTMEHSQDAALWLTPVHTKGKIVNTLLSPS
jgi:hypothetical protein